MPPPISTLTSWSPLGVKYTVSQDFLVVSKRIENYLDKFCAHRKPVEFSAFFPKSSISMDLHKSRLKIHYVWVGNTYVQVGHTCVHSNKASSATASHFLACLWKPSLIAMTGTTLLLAV